MLGGQGGDQIMAIARANLQRHIMVERVYGWSWISDPSYAAWPPLKPHTRPRTKGRFVTLLASLDAMNSARVQEASFLKGHTYPLVPEVKPQGNIQDATPLDPFIPSPCGSREVLNRPHTRVECQKRRPLAAGEGRHTSLPHERDPREGQAGPIPARIRTDRHRTGLAYSDGEDGCR